MSVVRVGSQAQRINPAEQTTVYNPSSTQTVNVGDTASPDTPIPPQGAFILDGGKPYWLQSADGTVMSVDLLKGLQGSIPSPAQIADQLTNSGLAAAIAADITASGLAASIASQISVTGVPLLNDNTDIDSLTGATMAANGNIVRGPFAIVQPAYEIGLSAWAAGGTSPTWMRIQLQWTDSVTGLVVGQRTYSIDPGSASGSAQTIMGVGPNRGDRLQVTFTNNDNAAGASGRTITFSYTLMTCSRVLSRDDWRTRVIGTPNDAITAAGVQVDSGVLCNTAPNIPAGTFVDRILGLYTGAVQIYGNCNAAGGGNANGEFIIRDVTGTLSNTVNLSDTKASASGLFDSLIYLPTTQCAVRMINNGANASQFSLVAVINEVKT